MLIKRGPLKSFSAAMHYVNLLCIYQSRGGPGLLSLASLALKSASTQMTEQGLPGALDFLKDFQLD